MGFGSNSERSSNPQQSSRTGKEKAHLPHADLRLKNQGKLNVKNDPYGILPGEIMNNRIQSTLVETKPFGDCKGQPLKRKPTKEDELVRYMSNLPGYLQRVDSSDNLQEKALNVGVLDWARLEKWKYHQKHMPTTTGNNVSRTNAKSSAFSNDVPKVASANKGMLRSSTCSSLTPSQKDDILEVQNHLFQRLGTIKILKLLPRAPWIGRRRHPRHINPLTKLIQMQFFRRGREKN
ncbi:uncharacterized protein LOC120135469 [Hibiscus syriacus]|uniref:uncharacterized protein LOC120135469 n=1 Tax=Hibiscus syriacus TaxID=106335 RepID=UPI001923F036|nr:uncharacterized protein LOC120135469 [Hibiscus syriacus]XP_039007674.1 uncharacterized protein LOC120135469 [Hibiscus syriacus]